MGGSDTLAQARTVGMDQRSMQDKNDGSSRMGRFQPLEISRWIVDGGVVKEEGCQGLTACGGSVRQES